MSGKNTEKNNNIVWQSKLLPFMVVLLSCLAIFFFISSVNQLYDLQNKIENSPVISLDTAFELLSNNEKNLSTKEVLEATRWKTLTLLESYALEQRYHQANALLMARVWIKHLGFVTGMILAFVGAVFILGKLREPTSNLDGEIQNFRLSISTSSPGIILAVLGSVLMVSTIFIHNKVKVDDAAIFLPGSSSAVAFKIPEPKDWPKDNISDNISDNDAPGKIMDTEGTDLRNEMLEHLNNKDE